MHNIVSAINSWIELENSFKHLVARDVAAFIHAFSKEQYTLATTPLRFTPITTSDGRLRCIIHFLQTDYELALYEADSLHAEIALSRMSARPDGGRTAARKDRLYAWELDRFGNVSDTADGSYTAVSHLGKAVFARICFNADHDELGDHHPPSAAVAEESRDIVILPDEDAGLPTADAQETVTVPRADMERFRTTLLAWWPSKRPPQWDEDDHVREPGVNLHEAADISLAQLIVELLGHGDQ